MNEFYKLCTLAKVTWDARYSSDLKKTSAPSRKPLSDSVVVADRGGDAASSN